MSSNEWIKGLRITGKLNRLYNLTEVFSNTKITSKIIKDTGNKTIEFNLWKWEVYNSTVIKSIYIPFSYEGYKIEVVE